MPTEGWTEADPSVPGPKSLLVFLTPSRFQASQRLAAVINKVTTNPPPAAKAN